MRQVLQSLADGKVALEEIPVPAVSPGTLLVRTSRSLISAGTERMLVDFGRAGWLEKARQQPEKVRQVIDKVRADGLLPTLEAVRSKLEQPIAPGYCNAGMIVGRGAGVSGFSEGDRVVSNGPHAEWVTVPPTLCARIPDGVLDDEASFTVVGAIGLQGIRLAAPTLGERFVVIGLGLIGLMTVQILRANGCSVLGIDPDPWKAILARQFGAHAITAVQSDDVLAEAHSFSRGSGIDGVIITAATDSNEPVKQAAQMCRQRGRIVLVGVAGLNLDRSDFYKKEISFQVSCSYGPGRYDPEYEEKGHDYPLGYVRWTEQRNFEAVLDLMASRSLDVRPLISHRFAFDSAPAAYDLLVSGAEPYLGILLEYSGEIVREHEQPSRIARLGIPTERSTSERTPSVAFIGAGNYAGRTLLPAFAASGARLHGIASARGVSASYYGRKFGFECATTDAKALIASSAVDIVVIATRHDSHARWIIEALAAGKHVYVEKPLAVTLADVGAIADAWERSGAIANRPQVMVGFNRRFAPQVLRMKSLLAGVREPKSFIVTVNAGALPSGHWTEDPLIGGGRVVGEACHFIDLLRYLAGHRVVASHAHSRAGSGSQAGTGNTTISLAFADGSEGTVHYLVDGHRAFPKERVEVFCAGRVLQLDNFRILRGHGWREFSGMKLWRQDKGQRNCVKTFVDAMRTGANAPIPMEEVLEVASVSVSAAEAAKA